MMLARSDSRKITRPLDFLVNIWFLGGLSPRAIENLGAPAACSKL
jgi:hypothetical protein